VAAENMLLDRVHKRTKKIAGRSYPTGQRGAGDLDALPGVDLRLPVKGKMICELRRDHVSKQTRCGKTALDRT
jgi:hypothetical protein